MRLSIAVGELFSINTFKCVSISSVHNSLRNTLLFGQNIDTCASVELARSFPTYIFRINILLIIFVVCYYYTVLPFRRRISDYMQFSIIILNHRRSCIIAAIWKERRVHYTTLTEEIFCHRIDAIKKYII